MARTAKKNDRCPFKDTCEQKCEWKNKEIECDFYRNNSCPGKEIEDQEELREKYLTEHAEVPQKQKGTIVYIPIDKLVPHKHNPRKDLGDLTELAESIKVKGVLQNLTVVPDKNSPDQYIIIIGHRRCAAAKEAGLSELPCIVADMDDKEQIETMLLENIQRSDLNALEQADGFQLMFDMGQSVDKISEKTGFSKTTVRKRLSIAKLDREKVAAAVGRQVTLGDFDKLTEIDSIEERNKLIDQMGTNNFSYSLTAALKAQERKKQGAEWEKIVAPHARNILDVQKEENSDSTAFDYIFSICGKNPSEEEWEKAFNERFEGKEVPAELFYKIETSWSMNVYIYKRKNGKEITPEEQAKIDAEKEIKAKLEELNNKLDAANKNAYETRYNFIKEWSFGDCLLTKDELTRLCLSVSIENLIGQYCDIEATAFADLCGIPIEAPSEDDDFSSEDVVHEITEHINENLPIHKVLVVHAYLSMEDRENMNENGTMWDKFKFNPSRSLELIYGFLEKIGYELSDEEYDLHNGSFVKELKEEMGLTE